MLTSLLYLEVDHIAKTAASVKDRATATDILAIRRLQTRVDRVVPAAVIDIPVQSVVVARSRQKALA